MRPSVIVINKKQEVREILSKFLSLNDIDVLATGSNGKDAADLFEKFKPDIAIMDLSMPKYDGFYGLIHIQKTNPHAKIIMITPSKDFKIKTKLEKSKCSAIIQNSCEMDKIIQIIHHLMLDYALTSM